MKKMLLLAIPAALCFWLTVLSPSSAEAYWGYRQYREAPPAPAFRPRFGISLSGGLHFVDFYNDSSYAFTYGVVEGGAHLWIHPNISLDLGIGTHFLANNWSGQGWGYVSFKPGARFRFGLFYLRTALDIGVGTPQSPSASRSRAAEETVMLFGLLVGLGVRVPVSRHVRLFAELDYQFNFAPDPLMMPFYGKLGVEVVF